MKAEENRLITSSKELLGKDRLDALEGKGKVSRLRQEMHASEQALKDLHRSFHDRVDIPVSFSKAVEGFEAADASIT
jgi:hypothetical protein